MITCNPKAPSTRLTVPKSASSSFWALASALTRLRYRKRSLTFRMPPLCRDILSRFLFLFRLCRWYLTENYPPRFAANCQQHPSSALHPVTIISSPFQPHKIRPTLPLFIIPARFSIICSLLNPTRFFLQA